MRYTRDPLAALIEGDFTLSNADLRAALNQALNRLDGEIRACRENGVPDVPADMLRLYVREDIAHRLMPGYPEHLQWQVARWNPWTSEENA